MKINNIINILAEELHRRSKAAGWYDDVEKNGVYKAMKICLMHSELSEAMEGERQNLMDDKLPHRPMAEVEMADTIIRILDYCAWLGYDVGGAIEEKMEFNKNRKDHKRETRSKDNGKKF